MLTLLSFYFIFSMTADNVGAAGVVVVVVEAAAAATATVSAAATAFDLLNL